MNNSMFTETEFLQYIGTRLAEYETQKELADQMHISPQYLTDILKGRRAVTDKVAEFFGRKRVVLFVVPVDIEQPTQVGKEENVQS